MRAYLGDREVDEAVFAMALPVEGDRVHLTNSPWDFSIEQTREALGIERLTIINDFSAQALAIPVLGARERRQIGEGKPVEGAPIGVIGPGTGLGVGGLLCIGGTWQPVASEGGHVSLAPRDETDAAVWAQLRRRFGHVSNERVLSGPGLVNLAGALAAIVGNELRIDDPKEVTRRAKARSCPFCVAALERFSALLGAAAGDLALTLCAQGGVYIGGGLVRALGGLFDAERFRAGFVAKGRFEDYLRDVPDLSGDPSRSGPARRRRPAHPQMSRAGNNGAAWPREGFWDYSVTLYARPGVEAACLELQRRHRIDVNLVLLCLWLGERGTALDGEALARLCHAADRWQLEVVRPLRNLRRRLKGRIADREPNSVAGDWPEIATSVRERAISLEIDAEHLEQVHLGRVAAGLPAGTPPGPGLAGANLRHYWRFDRRDHKALRTLLEQTFTHAAESDLEGGLRWLEGTQD